MTYFNHIFSRVEVGSNRSVYGATKHNPLVYQRNVFGMASAGRIVLQRYFGIGS